MKRRESAGRINWPREGVAIRVPSRRLAREGAVCECLSFTGIEAQPARAVAWNEIGKVLPRGTRVVLLVAAEDVSFSRADVPALSGLRLREALPNLVEDRTVGEMGTLHVALGGGAGGTSTGNERALAVVDRTWLAAIQVHVARAGLRVAAIVAESLLVPWQPGEWSVAGVAGDSASDLRLWIRTDAQQAIPLPDDAASAAATAGALARGAPLRPSRIRVYAARDVRPRLAPTTDAMGRAGHVAVEEGGGDPFVEWLRARGPDGTFGPPLSLLGFESSADGLSSTAKRWRIAAMLLVALAVVQIAGLQWEWARLRGEANGLRATAASTLTTAFPETRVVLDAPLQMSRNLAALRASSGHSDPADFSSMMAASGRIFAAVPSNGVKGAEYEARSLKLRLAPGIATAPDERERYVALAAQEGYLLRFDTAQANTGESIASLRLRGGA